MSRIQMLLVWCSLAWASWAMQNTGTSKDHAGSSKKDGMQSINEQAPLDMQSEAHRMMFENGDRAQQRAELRENYRLPNGGIEAFHFPDGESEEATAYRLAMKKHANCHGKIAELEKDGQHSTLILPYVEKYAKEHHKTLAEAQAKLIQDLKDKRSECKDLKTAVTEARTAYHNAIFKPMPIVTADPLNPKKTVAANTPPMTPPEKLSITPLRQSLSRQSGARQASSKLRSPYRSSGSSQGESGLSIASWPGFGLAPSHSRSMTDLTGKTPEDSTRGLQTDQKVGPARRLPFDNPATENDREGLSNNPSKDPFQDSERPASEQVAYNLLPSSSRDEDQRNKGKMANFFRQAGRQMSTKWKSNRPGQ